MAKPPNDLGQYPQLTPEQAMAGRMAMAAREQAAMDVKQFLQSNELKKFCIEKAVAVCLGPPRMLPDGAEAYCYDPYLLARQFYKFLSEE